MQIHHKPTKILIVGKSGSGKTTYLLRYAENSGHDRIYIFDHKLEFEERMGVSPSFTFDDVLERTKKGERYISYHYSEEYPGMAENAFQDYCELIYKTCQILREDGKKTLFVADEVNRFTDASDLGRSFKELIEDGRLQGLDFAGTSHAANQIHNRLRLQLSEIVALKTLDPRPLAFLEENGFDVEEVKNLQTGQYISKDLDHDTFKKGKLFSCVQKDSGVKRVEQTNSTEPLNPENDHGIIPDPAADPHSIYGDSGPRTDD
jgi:hypothetical protein